MANKYLDTSLVDKAIKFAVDAHAGTERRGKGFPYVIHVLEAMEIVATMTNDPELLAAAALHDTIEDTDVTFEQIRDAFGERVAGIVKAESDELDPGVREEDSWRSRKQAAIDRLSSAPLDAKTVALGDKLSNMRAIARDHDRIGDRLWSIFHAPGGKSDHEWHYRGLASALRELAGTDAYAEFTSLIDKVFSIPAPELVDMADYEESGDGYTAISYNHRDGKRMMKLYAEYISPAVPMREIKMSLTLSGMGLDTPKALRMVTDGKRTGVEFERITGKRSFARAISQEPENLEKYSRQFARMCRRLHSIPCSTAVFPSAKGKFIGAVNDSRRFSSEQKAPMLRFINSVPDALTCVHGDMHIGNALIAGGKEYWIDIADFGYGNPLFDLGMLYFVCHGVDDEETCQRLYHISADQIHQVWDCFVDEYYGKDVDREHLETIAAKLAAAYMVYFDNRSPISEEMVEFVKKHLIEDETEI